MIQYLSDGNEMALVSHHSFDKEMLSSRTLFYEYK